MQRYGVFKKVQNIFWFLKKNRTDFNPINKINFFYRPKYAEDG